MSNTLGNEAAIKPVRSLLPVLTVLFLISYGLLTMLVVEQSRTIDSQRGLIKDLFHDSVQLSSIQGKAIQKQTAQAQAQAKSHSQTKAPSAQAPPSQAPPRTDTQNRRTSKLRRPLPQKPPKDASGEGDERRMLISI